MTAKQLKTARDNKITEVDQLNETLLTLAGKKDEASKSARLSAGAKKANRNREIAEIEAELGREFGEWLEPYQAPRVVVRKRQQPRSAEQLQAAIDKNAAALASCPFENTKHTLSHQIDVLIKKAEELGHTVTDPR